MNEDNKNPNPAEEYMSKITNDNQPEPEQAAGERTGPAQSPITGEAFERRKPVFNPMGRVEDINADEVKVADIRRHFFGLFIIYLQVVLGVGLSLGLIVFLLPDVIGSSATLNAGLSLLSLVFIGMGLIFMVLATKIYNANQLIVTDIHVTQVLQIGLFSRKVSELTMENVEDVTSEQGGVFPTIFNYGTLKVETAGEQNNFVFKYCPNPNAYAKALQDARAAYFAKHNSAGNRTPTNI